MKSSRDPRHKKRRQIIKELFANAYVAQDANEVSRIIIEKQSEIDQQITTSAPQWPIDKLNRIDLAILRLATYEIMNTDTPPKVVIDEAVELAKEFGGESSPSFVNGVLGDVLKRSGKNVSQEEKNEN